jgi:hypothetical protein
MGREWDRKRKIDELLKVDNNSVSNNISADKKKDLEMEREKIKIQLKQKQARNRRNRLLSRRCSIIVLSAVPPTPIKEGTAGGQLITFTISVNGKTGPPATVVNM